MTKYDTATSGSKRETNHSAPDLSPHHRRPASNSISDESNKKYSEVVDSQKRFNDGNSFTIVEEGRGDGDGRIMTGNECVSDSSTHYCIDINNSAIAGNTNDSISGGVGGHASASMPISPQTGEGNYMDSGIIVSGAEGEGHEDLTESETYKAYQKLEEEGFNRYESIAFGFLHDPILAFAKTNTQRRFLYFVAMLKQILISVGGVVFWVGLWEILDGMLIFIPSDDIFHTISNSFLICILFNQPDGWYLFKYISIFISSWSIGRNLLCGIWNDCVCWIHFIFPHSSIASTIRQKKLERTPP